jgi:1-phosphatidylinositol-4-phosphate 5-kinase
VAKEKFKKTRHTFLSENGKYIYHIGIIDYLQSFTLGKTFENKFKTLMHKEGAEISAVEPKRYATRFLKFMRDKVIIN